MDHMTRCAACDWCFKSRDRTWPSRDSVKCSADPAPTLAPLLSVCLLFEMINNVTIVIGCPEVVDNITVNLVNAYSRINCIIMVTMNTISTTSNIGILLVQMVFRF